jgi:hypothetical protein
MTRFLAKSAHGWLIALTAVSSLALSFGAAEAEDHDRRGRRDAGAYPVPVVQPDRRGYSGDMRRREREPDPRYTPAPPPPPAYRPPASGYSGAMGYQPGYSEPHRSSLGADWRQQQDEARRAVREGRHVPLGQVLDQIRRSNPGRQLDAGIEEDPNGRTLYRVRWASANGRRMDYLVDAETGHILSVEGR